MKKGLQIIIVFFAGFFAYGILDRILSGNAEAKFRVERSRCQIALIEFGKQRASATSASAADNNDHYVFVNWSKLPDGAGTPSGKYPLAYDRRRSNHGGRGINILMSDGTVEWDSEAQWLKRYSTDHPTSRLPMPE